MKPELSYADVEEYLATFSTKERPYDFNGLLHLVLSGIENLRTNGLDEELFCYACSVSDEQAQFLQRLLDVRPESIAEFEKFE
jgi:hypothetical protein